MTYIYAGIFQPLSAPLSHQLVHLTWVGQGPLVMWFNQLRKAVATFQSSVLLVCVKYILQVVLHKHYYVTFALWHEPSVCLRSSLFICVHACLDTIAAHLFDTCVKTFTGVQTFLTTKTEWEVPPTSWKTSYWVRSALRQQNWKLGRVPWSQFFLSSKPYDIPSAFQWPIFTKFGHDMRVHVTGILLERIFANFV